MNISCANDINIGANGFSGTSYVTNIEIESDGNLTIEENGFDSSMGMGSSREVTVKLSATKITLKNKAFGNTRYLKQLILDSETLTVEKESLYSMGADVSPVNIYCNEKYVDSDIFDNAFNSPDIYDKIYEIKPISELTQ